MPRNALLFVSARLKEISASLSKARSRLIYLRHEKFTQRINVQLESERLKSLTSSSKQNKRRPQAQVPHTNLANLQERVARERIKMTLSARMSRENLRRNKQYLVNQTKLNTSRSTQLIDLHKTAALEEKRFRRSQVIREEKEVAAKVEKAKREYVERARQSALQEAHQLLQTMQQRKKELKMVHSEQSFLEKSIQEARGMFRKLYTKRRKILYQGRR